MKLFRLCSVTILASFFTINVQAAPLCSYQFYALESTTKSIVSALKATGLSVAPTTEDSLRVLDLALAVPGYAGTWTVREDSYLRTEIVDMKTVDGRPLVTITEEVYQCAEFGSASTCYETNYYLRGERSPAFTIRQGLRGLEHLRYGREVNVTIWRHGLQDIQDWITEYYLTSERVFLQVPATAPEAVAFYASINPLLNPFQDYFQVIWTAEGTIVLTGVLPSNAAYNALIGILIDLGIYSFDNRLIIDTALVGRPLPFSGPLEYCL